MASEERLFYSLECDDSACLSLLIQEGLDVNHVFYGTCPLSKSHWSALHICCEKGRYHCAKILLEAGADPNIPDKYGQSPLMYAVSCGWRDLVQLLLNHGADVTMKDFTGRTAVHTVSATDDIGILELLMQFQASILQTDQCGITPLWLAASSESGAEMLQAVVKYTLVEGDLNARDSRRGRNALQAAIMNTDTDLCHKVQVLIHSGIEIQKKDFSHMTPCMNLVKRWQEAGAKSRLNSRLKREIKECFTMIITSGYDVNQVTTGIKSMDHDGSVLHMAARYGISELIHFIITEFDADINCKNSKDHTPVFLAVQYQHLDAVKMLVEHSCDLYRQVIFKVGQSLPICGTVFRFALELGLVDMAMLVYHAGYSLQYEEYLTEKQLDMPVILKMNSNLKDMLYCLKLKSDPSQPKNLYDLCFSFIWYTVLPREKNNIYKIALPQHVKNDLCYRGIF